MVKIMNAETPFLKSPHLPTDKLFWLTKPTWAWHDMTRQDKGRWNFDHESFSFGAYTSETSKVSEKVERCVWLLHFSSRERERGWLLGWWDVKIRMRCTSKCGAFRHESSWVCRKMWSLQFSLVSRVELEIAADHSRRQLDERKELMFVICLCLFV